MARSQVGAAWQYSNTASASSIALPSRTTIAAGSLVIVAWRYETGTAALTGVADSAGQSYTVVTGAEYGAAEPRVGLAYKYNHPGGSNVVITISLSGARAYRNAHAVEYTGSDSSDPLDTSTTVNTASQAAVSASYTASADGMAFAITGPFGSTSSWSFDSPSSSLDTTAYSALWTRAHTAGAGITMSTPGFVVNGNTNTIVGVFKNPTGGATGVPKSTKLLMTGIG